MTDTCPAGRALSRAVPPRDRHGREGGHHRPRAASERSGCVEWSARSRHADGNPHHRTPGRPYNPHRFATPSHAASSNKVYPHGIRADARLAIVAVRIKPYSLGFRHTLTRDDYV
jgi:hypothetical protein